jgi:hypothetical protein
VNVAVAQSSGQSNNTPLQIGALPSAPPSAPGTVTLGFLQGDLLALESFQQHVSGTAQDSAQLDSALSVESNALTLLINQLTPLANGTVSSVTLSSINGTPLNITPADLTVSDRDLIALVQAVAAFPASSVQSANVERPMVQIASATTTTTSTISSDAQDLYNISISGPGAAVQGQMSTAYAKYITDGGNPADFNAERNMRTLAGAGFTLLNIMKTSAGHPLAAAVEESSVSTVYLEELPTIGTDAVLAVGDGLGVINALLNPLVTFVYGATAGAVVALVVANVAVWGLVAEEICGPVGCFPYQPLPPSIPIVMTGFTLNPYGTTTPGLSAMSVVGGTPVTAVLTLSGPAPVGGLSILFSSDNSNAGLNTSSTIIPEGISNSSFTVRTSSVAISTPIHLSAQAGGQAQTATLTLTPQSITTPPVADAVSPTSQSLGSAGGCGGGTLNGSFSITAAKGITWTVTGDPNNNFPGSPASSMSVSTSGVTINVPAQLPSSSYSNCSLQWKLGTFDNIYVTFSDGTVIPVTVSWTFIGTT